METNKDLKVVSTLWGEEIISLRDDRIAGQVAKEEGDKFENYVEELLIENLVDSYGVINQPLYTNYYGMSGLRKDFKLIPKSDLFCEIKDDLKSYMIEAKQLGLVSNNVQKLDYEWNNLRAGCYGNNFWLVYDYERYNKSAIKWVGAITEYCLKMKKEVAKEGITFEWIDHNNFKKLLIEECCGNN